MKAIIGNWKSNKNVKEALEWLEIVGPSLTKSDDLEISIAPQLSLLSLLSKEIQNKGYHLTLSAQDVSPFEEGPYTGEVSVRALSEIVKYVLVGHSERRRNFGEDNFLVNLKVHQCLKYELTPIVCISDLVTPQGTILEDPSFNKDNFLKEITEAINEVEKIALEKVVFMYEPPSAISKPVGSIGIGEAALITEVLEMTQEIKKISPKSKIYYGGSVKSSNIKIYLQQAEIDGVVCGSASLNPQEFLKMISNARQI